MKKRKIFIERGQMVFLRSNFKNKLIYTSIKNYGGNLDLVGHLRFPNGQVYYNQPEIINDPELDQMIKLLEFNENGLWMEKHNLSKLGNLKKDCYGDFFKLVLDFLESDKYQNRYKCTHENNGIQLWIPSKFYDDVREKLIYLAYFNEYRLEGESYHPIYFVPIHGIVEISTSYTSYNRKKVFEIINDNGLFYEVIKNGIPINIINNKEPIEEKEPECQQEEKDRLDKLFLKIKKIS